MDYQLNYAAGRPQMYDKLSREKRAYRIIRFFEDLLGKSGLKDLVVYDLGCSTGIIDNVLSKKFKKVVGGDIDEEAVAFAKKTFINKNLEFRIENATNLSFPDNTFDIVICTHIYEHVPDPKKLFQEIKRILKPGGFCYLAAINKFWLVEPHYNLPFLSYLPKKLANFYMRVTKKGSIYFETPQSYWGLENLTKDFKKIDYTDKILKDPIKYDYENIYSLSPIFIWIIKEFAPILKYFVPTFFWILEKEF